MTTQIRSGIRCPNCNTEGAWARFSDPGYGEHLYQDGPIRCVRCGWDQNRRPLLRKNRMEPLPMEPLPTDKANGIDYPTTTETIIGVGAYAVLGLLVAGASIAAVYVWWKIMVWLG